MIALRLALRNLKRNRRRTVLTAVALAVGIMVLITARGFLDGIDRQSIDNLIDYDLADIKAFHPGYLDDDFPDLKLAIHQVDSLLGVIRGTDASVSATARLEMAGLLISGIEETFTRVIGVNPDTDPRVFKTLQAVVKGETLADDTPRALIGDRLASDLGLDIGDIITVLVRSAPGALNPRDLPISGIIATGHPKVDQSVVYIPLAVARDMALLPDAATEIAVRTERRKDSERVRNRLARELPSLDWRSWRSLASDFITLTRMKRAGQTIVIAVLVLMAAVGIANTQVISVHERTREIGALRALGFTSGQVGSIFLWEGALIGMLAGCAAVVVGGAVLSYLGVHGISLAAYKNIDIGYPVRDAIYPMVKASSVLGSFLFGVILSLAASWGSARRAARGQVVRALREGAL